MARDINPLQVLQNGIISCEICPRLVAYRAEVARAKRRAYRDWTYWGKPVPGFGDPDAELLIVGLAPAAHGANRTGRMFTGDRSGDFLYRALYETGFASQPSSMHIGDGLALQNAYVTAPVRCAPPGNKPLPEEFRACRPWLSREIDLLPRVRCVVALGRIAFDSYLAILQERGLIARRSAFTFGHNKKHWVDPGLPALIASYHPSQQNTSTGVLTFEMLRDVFRSARRELETSR